MSNAKKPEDLEKQRLLAEALKPTEADRQFATQFTTGGMTGRFGSRVTQKTRDDGSPVR